MNKKKLWIIPVVIVVLVVLVFVMGGGLSMMKLGRNTQKENLYLDLPETETTDYKNAYKGSGVPDVLTEDVMERYRKALEPADDAYDFLYATDYQDLDLVKIYKGRDSASYQRILGYGDATLEQIRQALDGNDNISPKYKDFIYQYACDLRTLYPDCNLAVLYHNLHTLVIDEMSQAEIDKETLSTDSAACYLRYENRICVAEDLDFSRESNDYIILTHELCHAARCVQVRPEDPAEYDIDIGFYDDYKMGIYAEEGVITNIAYELQGLGQKAIFYPVLASYYRIIGQCIDYSGEDFFNHSLNYLIGQMDAFMGDEMACEIIARIDAQMTLRYTPYNSVDFHDFQPVYDYLARMYFKKFIHPGMTKQQAQEVFDAFYEDISFHFENLNRDYDISEETFVPAFTQFLEAQGIQ